MGGTRLDFSEGETSTVVHFQSTFGNGTVEFSPLIFGVVFINVKFNFEQYNFRQTPKSAAPDQ